MRINTNQSFIKKNKPLLLCLCGPTAAGKSALALRLCETLNGEVISADSMQIYRGMDIVTAKPSAAELARVRHHMINVADPSEHYSAARYAESARAAIEDVLSRGKLPVVCGGTGLYIRALLDGGGMGMGGCAGDADIRNELKTIYLNRGSAGLYGLLAARDPERAARLHPNDVKRVTRALEVIMSTGMTMAEYNTRAAAKKNDRYDVRYYALSFQDRNELYRRIDARVNDMLSRGLEGEARMYYDNPSALGPTAAKAIGYQDFFSYFNGEITKEQAVASIKQHTRNYAKRQLTWFSKDTRCTWLWRDESDFDAEAGKIITNIKEMKQS